MRKRVTSKWSEEVCSSIYRARDQMKFEHAKLSCFFLELVIRLSSVYTMTSYRYLNVALCILLPTDRNSNITQEISLHHLVKSRLGFLFNLYHNLLHGEKTTTKNTTFSWRASTQNNPPNFSFTPHPSYFWGRGQLKAWIGWCKWCFLGTSENEIKPNHRNYNVVDLWVWKSVVGVSKQANSN